MRITAVKPVRGQLVQVTLDEDAEQMVEVDAATFKNAGYRVGAAIDTDALAALLAQSKRNRARSRALYYLSGRDYAAGELTRKLQRSTDRETAAAVVERLMEVGLVDDAAYAGRLAQSFSQYRLYPKRRVLQELRARGIDRETAENAVEEADIDDFALALALLQKKYYNKLADEQSRKKTVAALMRAGFSPQIARRAVETAAGERDGDDYGY